MNGNDDKCMEKPLEEKKIKRHAFSLDISTKNDNVLNEFAELSTNEDLIKLQNEFEIKARTPLSGFKLVHYGDESSPYLYCSRYFSQSSPSALVPFLDRNITTQNTDLRKAGNKIAEMIDDPSVWPYVWTTFGRGCTVQYTQDDYKGPEISLANLRIVDEDIHLQEFQRFWNLQSKFLVVDKLCITSQIYRLKICSCLYADRHAGHLIVTVPVHHPFFVENRGWCQVESSNMNFHSLEKLDVICSSENKDFFRFDDKIAVNPLKEEKSITAKKSIEEKSTKEVIPKPKLEPIKKKQDTNIPPPLRPSSLIMPSLTNIQEQGMSFRPPQRAPGPPPLNISPYRMPPSFPPLPPPIQPPPPSINFRTPYVMNVFDFLNQKPNMITKRMGPYFPQPLGQQKFIKSYRTRDEKEKQVQGESGSMNQYFENQKRPMNGFMIFAREMRLQVIHENPGKDNRVVSKILGEKWKDLPFDVRKKYADTAKEMSDKRKKINPMCWKRKRRSSKKNFETHETNDLDSFYDYSSNYSTPHKQFPDQEWKNP